MEDSFREMATDGEDNFGSDIELDDELEGVLTAVESQGHARHSNVVTDIEDMIPRVSPFLEFRKKGWLSVSDLVGLLWCEVQVRKRKGIRLTPVRLVGSAQYPN